MNAKRQRVADLIRHAFQGVTLGNGVGLWEGRALDDYADARGMAAARLRDERTEWSRIPLDDLCQCESSLTFADAEGVRFLLPAFMMAELEDRLPAGIVFNLTSGHDLPGHFAALSSEQRAAVREFLLALRDERDYAFERQDIDEALKTNWAT
jgi:hypothetical protein